MKKKKRFISKKAQDHASRGTFIYPQKYLPKKVLTMKSGGHGQENISFLNKKKISHDIETIFSNGVRLGHIDNHIKAYNCRKNGHAWFPTFWSKQDIKNAGLHVASLKRNTPLRDNQKHTGRYKGVSVGIYAKKNRIQTIFPCFDVNKHAKKKTHSIFTK